MEFYDLKKRIEDLQSRAECSSTIASSLFLTPAEQYRLGADNYTFVSGNNNAERKIAVFFPEWIDKDSFDISTVLSCIKIQSYYGTPSHRDYLGSILGLGIKREWIGDIVVDDNAAYVVCINSVKTTLLNDLNKVGRTSVKTFESKFTDIPEITADVKKLTFTVMSLRLDAVCGEMFSMSRTAAAEKIKQGIVSLNYEITYKTDAAIGTGDVISMRGKGKGCITAIGGLSRKGRTYVNADYLR